MVRLSRRTRRQKRATKYKAWPEAELVHSFDIGDLGPGESAECSFNGHVVVRDRDGNVVRESES